MKKMLYLDTEPPKAGPQDWNRVSKELVATKIELKGKYELGLPSFDDKKHNSRLIVVVLTVLVV